MNKTENNNNLIFLIGGIIILLIVVSVFIKPRNKEDNHSTVTAKPKPYNDFSYIIPGELRKKITDREPLTLLDIRDAVNFRKTHIENSINIPYNDYSPEAVNRLPKNVLTVVISYDYEDKKELGDTIKALKDLGFEKVVALSGGIKAWKEDNNPTINEGDPESVVDSAKVEYVLPEQLKLAIDKGYPTYVLDVRPTLLYKQGHIPGAKNIPFENLEKRKTDLPIAKEIVVYGRTELEDFKACVKLYDLGFMATYAIKGGLKEWKNKGFELVK